ncbi:MAG: diaminopimelate epimerase [SAR86 cluster bacterium]|uniref:Diaminopimelate epimerase n=1 Tax=SAR86 cluster bacterium TaxID=2030880 RepID=A0A2A5CJI5_9GAMM|nr:MAG: diaminopimelate epimerase [SAR86 cluster bacterium]
MSLRFTKMHGLGNDFMLLDRIQQDIPVPVERIPELADRHTGVGFDQLLIIEPASIAGSDFNYRIYNADGSEVEQCGNGARCVMRYLIDQGLSKETKIALGMPTGNIIHCELVEDGQITVDMGAPITAPQAIPLLADAEAITYPLKISDDNTIEIAALSMGNPHAVYQVDDVDTAPVAELGPLIEKHELFPERVNAGFMQIISPELIRLRVYERGAGETLACGTGACAAVVAGILRSLLSETVTVEVKGGKLSIMWKGAGHPVLMTGPATTVYEGHLNL